MPNARRRITAVLHDFQTEIKRLKRLDTQNQIKINLASAKITPGLSKPQLYFLTESIFFRSFQAYVNFVRDIFILYCLGKRPRSGVAVTSFLNPKDFYHAERLIKSSMPFLDWASPDTVIDRAELYLKNGFPFKTPYVTHLDTLRDIRRIRNHIAHNSRESLEQYKIVLRKHYATIPLKIPPTGQFLLVIDKPKSTKYKLIVFLDLMLQLASDLT